MKIAPLISLYLASRRQNSGQSTSVLCFCLSAGCELLGGPTSLRGCGRCVVQESRNKLEPITYMVMVRKQLLLIRAPSCFNNDTSRCDCIPVHPECTLLHLHLKQIRGIQNYGAVCILDGRGCGHTSFTEVSGIVVKS